MTLNHKPHWSDRYHAETCRRCGDVDTRDSMFRASIVLGGNARGWFCETCGRLVHQGKVVFPPPATPN